MEYTPQAYLQSDLQMFARNYSTDLIGKEPYLVSIDGGKDLFSGSMRVQQTLNLHLTTRRHPPDYKSDPWL